MNYKEKFEEFLSKMQGLLNNVKKQGHDIVRVEDLENAFPELKESEDERIRKALVEHIKGIYKGSCTEEMCKERDMFLAWLEKQGGQNSANKAKPKFNVGEWITDGYLHNKITDVLEDRYIVETKYAKRSAILFDYESRYHLWTIQDAKDGDVLVHSSFMFDDFIFIYNNTSILQAYCYYSNERNRFIIEDRGHYCPWNMQEVTPATKEQRDLLFQKMKEAGYTFDFEKKELEKIIDEKQIKKNLQDNSFRRMFEQKSVWSEDDEFQMQGIIDLLPGLTIRHNWLKSLKDRYIWKPSDEQMNALDSTLQYSQVSHNSFEYLNSLFNELKKLREEK